MDMCAWLARPQLGSSPGQMPERNIGTAFKAPSVPDSTGAGVRRGETRSKEAKLLSSRNLRVMTCPLCTNGRDGIAAGETGRALLHPRKNRMR
jgi:hypothetical protein